METQSATRGPASSLASLFFKYPTAHFDIYHISYPYEGELITLAKNFPNVAVDFCWMWIINPATARWALAEFLDAVRSTRFLDLEAILFSSRGATATP